MFCYNCGKQLKDGDRFCDKCGFPVQAAAEAKPAEEPVAEPAAENGAPAQEAPQYTPPQYIQPPVKEENKLMGILSLICGVGSFIFGWVPFLMFVPEILAAVFGIVGIVKKSGKAMAIAGLVLGIVAFFTTLMMSLLTIFLLLGGFTADYFFNMY